MNNTSIAHPVEKETGNDIIAAYGGVLPALKSIGITTFVQLSNSDAVTGFYKQAFDTCDLESSKIVIFEQLLWEKIKLIGPCFAENVTPYMLALDSSENEPARPGIGAIRSYSELIEKCHPKWGGKSSVFCKYDRTRRAFTSGLKVCIKLRFPILCHRPNRQNERMA